MNSFNIWHFGNICHADNLDWRSRIQSMHPQSVNRGAYTKRRIVNVKSN